MKSFTIGLFSAAVLFSSCSKIDNSNNTPSECNAVKAATIVALKDTNVSQQVVIAPANYNAGDNIHLSIHPSNPRPDGYISWYKGTNSGQLSTDASLDIYGCTKSDEGWYYMAISNADCGTFSDSIYVTVKNAAVTVPCSLGNNSVTFSSIPDISPATVTYGSSPDYDTKAFDAYAAYGYPELHVYFNQYWNSKEPEDGKYSVGQLGDLFDISNTYELTVSCLYESIPFYAGSGDVYVSHVNGKIVVAFCSLSMTGYNGQSFTTVAAGQLTAP